MRTPTDQQLAGRMLEVARRGGYSFGLYLKWQRKLYIVALAYLVLAVAYFAYVRFWGGCFLVVGLFAGMWLRDYGFLRAATRTWPFTNAVIDWDKVKRIAGEELESNIPDSVPSTPES